MAITVRNSASTGKQRKLAQGVVLSIAIAALATGCGNDSTPAAAPPISAPPQAESPRVEPAQPADPGQVDGSVPAADPVPESAQREPVSESTPPAQADPEPTNCGVNLGAPEVRAAVASLAPWHPRGSTDAQTWPWSTNTAVYDGNYDPCATLSTVIVTIAGSTASSPDHALMFHKGEYLGTATSEAHGFTRLDEAATTDDTVGLTYMTPGTCNACNDGTYTPVSFHWDGSSVQMIGQPPAIN